MPTKMEDPKKTDLIPIIEMVFMWALSSFMFVAGIVFFPSVSSVCLFLFTLIAVPCKPIQDFLESRHIKGIIKAIILVALFTLSVVFYSR